MIRQAIEDVVSGRDLSEDRMKQVMGQIMQGQATPAQIGAFLAGLRMKGETIAEIAGAAVAMRTAALAVPTEASARGRALLDLVGTGGDGTGTFNISTTAAFVAAGAGVAVAKHGNRAVSSKSGAADLMESLGVPLNLSPQQIGACVDRAGIGFLFAPALHPAMAHAVGPRREIGMRTVFNILGPLTNPAGASHLLLGVYQAELVRPLARVLARMGAVSALVVHGQGGYDEVSLTGPTTVCRLSPGGTLDEFTITPQEAGLAPCKPRDLVAAGPRESRRVTLEVLDGKPGPQRDMVLINAGAGLMAAGLAEDISRGVALAANSIDSGQARARLDLLLAVANQQAPAEAKAS